LNLAQATIAQIKLQAKLSEQLILAQLGEYAVRENPCAKN